jgi:hypothetical protein
MRTGRDLFFPSPRGTTRFVETFSRRASRQARERASG